jgi:hypothetical protein
VGLVGVTLGLLGMLAMTAHSSWWVLEPGFIAASIGTGLFKPAVSTVVLRESSADNAGLAAGGHDTFRQGGIALGVAVLGSLVPAAGALGAGDGTAFVDGLKHATLIAAGLSAVGAVASAYLIDRRPRRSPSVVVELPEQPAYDAPMAEAVVAG